MSIKDKRFVVHFHMASHNHYDLRLEIDGVLKSWAIPKVPPKEKAIKRLAIEVEDHKLSYIDFEGEISENHYGAGQVKIWDNGNFKLLENTKKKIEFELEGKKLKGKYVLVKVDYGIHPEKNWLFMKI